MNAHQMSLAMIFHFLQRLSFFLGYQLPEMVLVAQHTRFLSRVRYMGLNFLRAYVQTSREFHVAPSRQDEKYSQDLPGEQDASDAALSTTVFCANHGSFHP